MKTAFQQLYDRKEVFYTFVLLLLVGFLVIAVSSKDEFHIYLNQFHSNFFDVFFKYITHLGDGIFTILIILFFIIFKREYTKAFIVSGLLTLVISYVLKHLIFEIYRPTYNIDNLYLVEGVFMQIKHSFPSGHTTAAFSMGMLLVLFLKEKKGQMLVFVLAVLVAVSRVYLSQHYLVDVLAGSVLGTLIALVSYEIGMRKVKG